MELELLGSKYSVRVEEENSFGVIKPNLFPNILVAEANREAQK